MTDMPNFWWCPTHHLYRGGIERPCADAVKLGDVEAARELYRGVARVHDALRAEIRAVLDDLADASADGQTHREEDYGPDAVRHRAYARGLSYAVDCIRAIVEREPAREEPGTGGPPQPDSETEWGWRAPWDDSYVTQRPEVEARRVVAQSAPGARVLVCREVGPWIEVPHD